MTRFLCAIFVCLLGCGDQHVSHIGTPADELHGDWVIDDPSKQCEYLAQFRGDGFVLQKACVLTDGTLGSAMLIGTFEADSQTLTLHPKQASCAGENGAPVVDGYELDGSTLTIVMPGGVRVYERASSAPASGRGLRGGILTTGCFDDAGRFAPRPIGPVGT